jgi:hypothetical protein
MAAQARRRRPLAAPAAVALALVLAGCGSGEGIARGGKVIGKTLTVYSVTPDPGNGTRDFVAGEKLALADAHGRAGALSVNFAALDLGDGADDTAAQSVRRAIADPQVIAVIATATPVTVPLFNAAGLLHVAPTGDTALAHDPNELPSGRRTAASLEATAAGREAVPADFARRFQTEFSRAPQPSAALGYRSMRSVLEAIAHAGALGNDRQTVIDRYFAD